MSINDLENPRYREFLLVVSDPAHQALSIHTAVLNEHGYIVGLRHSRGVCSREA
jgi:hypothetical protein